MTLHLCLRRLQSAEPTATMEGDEEQPPQEVRGPTCVGGIGGRGTAVPRGVGSQWVLPSDGFLGHWVLCT